MAFAFIPMTPLHFSFIVPVYNRPQELQELLQSLSHLEYDGNFEVVIIEDGSTEDAESVVNRYRSQLNLSYHQKENTGPGNSRNYGMQKAKGNYFIILDSDCVLPKAYLKTVAQALTKDYVDFYGGPDAAQESFTPVQKAINHTMTSFLTTGGIRGKKRTVNKFQPRSFNMGISKAAFEATGGFGNIHPGEDPDLTFRLWDAGFSSSLLSDAFVYHKRRIDWKRFYTQVHKFGLVRPILNRWHPHTAKLTYCFPTLFLLGLLFAIVLAVKGFYVLLYGYVGYLAFVFVEALWRNKNLIVALLSVLATCIQFFGYGLGFLKSTFLLNFSKKTAKELFPKLFFSR